MTELKVLSVEEQVANTLAADAKRVRELAGLALALWFSAAIGVGGLLWLHFALELYRVPPADLLDRKLTLLALTVAVVTAAGPVTVWLLHAMRRATLRQIQASLAAIAGQLAEVQRGRGTMPPTAGG